MTIHSTAIVSPQATLAEDVEVGPYSVIGPQVTLGPGCVVGAHAVLEGHVTAGANNSFGHGVVIGAPPQDFAFQPSVFSEVRIGDGNTFREYVTIHRGTKEGSATVVGNGCYLMAGAHLGHNVQLADKVIIANNCLLAGYVEVASGAVLGGGAVFHQFIRVGALVMVSGGTRFGKDIPPYAMADGKNSLAGLNSVGMRRAGIGAEARAEIRRAFHLVYWSGLNVSQALEKANETTWGPEAAAFFTFIAESKRGVCRLNRRQGEE